VFREPRGSHGCVHLYFCSHHTIRDCGCDGNALCDVSSLLSLILTTRDVIVLRPKLWSLFWHHEFGLSLEANILVLISIV